MITDTQTKKPVVKHITHVTKGDLSKIWEEDINQNKTKKAESLLSDNFDSNENSYFKTIPLKCNTLIRKYLHSDLKETVNVNVLSYSLDKLKEKFSLNHIYDEITHSHDLLDLQEDWDEQGALAIDKDVYQASIDFLLMYAKYLLAEKQILLEAPEINPTRSGTVDIFWSTDHARMLINIRRKGDEMVAYFYGDLKDDEEGVKGNVSAKKITKYLASWMESLGK
ncbi:MAG: hypothetical protein WD267_04050 [Balneolales bacterium]